LDYIIHNIMIATWMIMGSYYSCTYIFEMQIWIKINEEWL